MVSGWCFAEEWLPQRDFSSIHQYQERLSHQGYPGDLLLDRGNGFSSVRNQRYDWWNQPVSGEPFMPAELMRSRVVPYSQGYGDNSRPNHYQRNSRRYYDQNPYDSRNQYVQKYSNLDRDVRYKRHPDSRGYQYQSDQWVEKDRYKRANQGYDRVVYADSYPNNDVYLPAEYGYQNRNESDSWDGRLMNWHDGPTLKNQPYRWWDWPVYGE